MKRRAFLTLIALFLLAGSALAGMPDPERIEDYSTFVNLWRFVTLAAAVGMSALLLFTRLSARFRDWTSSIKPSFLALWSFLALILTAEYLLFFPLNFYRGFIVEHSFGFSHQTFGQWLGEDLLELAVSVVISIVPGFGFYWLIERTKRWWFWFAAASVPVMVIAVIITPVVIAPIFNDYTPIKDQALETEIRALAQRGGIADADIFQVDGSKQSTKVNAYVTGLLGSSRIVFYDTMLDSFTTDEIVFVMAHEMGHYVLHHIWKGVPVAFAVTLLGLWLLSRLLPLVLRRFRVRWGFSDLNDRASLPLLMAFAVVYMFMIQPFPNAVSRHVEREADEYALEISEVPAEVAISAYEKLSRLNLSDPDPNPIIHFWFHTHPSIKERLERVGAYRQTE